MEGERQHTCPPCERGKGVLRQGGFLVGMIRKDNNEIATVALLLRNDMEGERQHTCPPCERGKGVLRPGGFFTLVRMT